MPPLYFRLISLLRIILRKRNFVDGGLKELGKDRKQESAEDMALIVGFRRSLAMISIMADCNHAYSAKVAIRVGKELENMVYTG